MKPILNNSCEVVLVNVTKPGLPTNLITHLADDNDVHISLLSVEQSIILGQLFETNGNKEFYFVEESKCTLVSIENVVPLCFSDNICLITFFLLFNLTVV